MKVWKQNQKLYHLLTSEYSDDLNKMDVEYDFEDLVGAAMKFVAMEPTEEPIYPGKAYSVAIIYSRLLRDHFGEDFYEVLDDPMLMYGNDEWFVPYSEAPEVYDSIIEKMGGIDNIPLTGRWVDFTVNYFKEECLGESDCFNLPEDKE